jgi:aryl-alcohol dehydrogenase-like predicted oxidoreductase
MGNRGLFFPFFDEKTGWEIVDKVKQIAKEQGTTPSQVAIAWLLAKRHIVLIGAKTLQQFDENLDSLNVNLTKDQLDQLEELTKPRQMYPNWMIQRQNAGREFEILPADWAR